MLVGNELRRQMMKYNLLAIIGLLIVCVLIARIRIKWMKGIPDMSNNKVLEAIASRIVLDLILVAVFVWGWIRSKIIPKEFYPLHLRTIIMTAIVIAFFTFWGILRWKFLPPKDNKREGDADIKSA